LFRRKPDLAGIRAPAPRISPYGESLAVMRRTLHAMVLPPGSTAAQEAQYA
jgi:hypothetical protein